jgi:membrane protease YdiL (CAAX protease family)
MTDDLPPLLPEAPAPVPPPRFPDVPLEEGIVEAGPGGVPPLPEAGGDPERPKKPQPGFWLALLLCIAFVFFTQVPGGLVAAGIVFVAIMRDPRAAGPGGGSLDDLLKSPLYAWSLLIAMIIAEFLVVSVAWLVTRLMVGRDWPRQLALRRPGWAHLVLAVFSAPALALAADGCYRLLGTYLHVPSLSDLGLPGMEQAEQLSTRWPATLAVLLIGVAPALGEELWCRGFLGRGLVGRYGWLGVVAASFFFGLIHGDPRQGLMALVMGLWLHFSYLMTRSLLIPMVLHFLNNTLSILSARFVTDVPGLETNALQLPVYLWLSCGLLLAAVGWAMYRSRARLVGDDGGPPPWQPPFPGVAYPPPGSATRVAHPRPPLPMRLVVAAAFVVFVVYGFWVFATI